MQTNMSKAANENMVVHSMDFKSAYLNAEVDCEIFLEQPKGFIIKNDNNEDLVLKLKKSLYGLKQSGRMWNNLLHSFLVDLGFLRSEAENCVYVRCTEGAKIIIIVWVDDLIIAGSDLDAVEQVKEKLKQKFKMKDFKLIEEFLGIQFELGENCVKLHQEKYAGKILEIQHISLYLPIVWSVSQNNNIDQRSACSMLTKIPNLTIGPGFILSYVHLLKI